ncbi:uncharacterized protein HRG_10315 [Hirsutella rhossiliensis]|uniref:G-patch domain-containing protein n=1 Tax=Hirsutella rhossiliensis TaxID=111463 RepID=A0A9P8MNF5_9HYPO|nr:uncharacterized protein HRG_10315 [Hirsutella rhossiliensis]KAH0958628.1 hypothetical protein HRG_10315 [Hirsutella rhossiliensis]
MSHKRSRAAFEADNHAPFAVFGTPLPDEAETRDDGSFLPLWKQEVRDDKGRKRLHGAFTGGWSAGYFNTVGSKEGWTPSTFKSSRANRHQDGAVPAQQRAEDYMDDEDLADAAEAQMLHTTQAFAGLGSSALEDAPLGGLGRLLRAQGDTMGLQLLRRMGWKDGQGIGPKVRRGARLDLDRASGDETYFFAPDNAPMIRFVRKTDRKGLGHRGETRLQGSADTGPCSNILSEGQVKQQSARGAFGVGVLNDTGSDDEDPYDIGPKINYNRTIGGQKKRKNKKAASAVVNPALANAPKFVPKTARAGNGLRRCHDGRLPLDGFALAKLTEDFAALFSQYAPPPIPSGWKSARDPSATPDTSQYVSTADAAKASSLDPRSRAAMLGEKSLPGKSVFDYLSASTRDKLAAASGKSNLPPARGEVLAHNAGTEEERLGRLWDRVPRLDRNSAAAALSRVARGPYADDDFKRARYRRYLEHQSNPGLPRPEKTEEMIDDDFLREMSEFYECARIFKPMTGFMASRFTTSKAASDPSGGAAGAELPSKPEPKVVDTAEEAARLGMFGHLTRSVEQFFPSALLCKRFNVRAPAHSRADWEAEQRSTGSTAEVWSVPGSTEQQSQRGASSTSASGPVREPEVGEVDPGRNEALEGDTANAGVLRAIFGDDDSE